MVCRRLHGRFRRAMAIATGRSPRPTPCRARPMINTVNHWIRCEHTAHDDRAKGDEDDRPAGGARRPAAPSPAVARAPVSRVMVRIHSPGGRRHPVVPRQGGDERARRGSTPRPSRTRTAPGGCREPQAQRRDAIGPDRVRGDRSRLARRSASRGFCRTRHPVMSLDDDIRQMLAKIRLHLEPRPWACGSCPIHSSWMAYLPNSLGGISLPSQADSVDEG